MHQTWSFKRINGTAYPESIASILRGASGGELRSTKSAARELTSLPESNRSVGSLNRLLLVLSARSASPLTLEARLAESSDASEPMFAFEDREVPEMEEVWMPC